MINAQNQGSTNKSNFNLPPTISFEEIDKYYKEHPDNPVTNAVFPMTAFKAEMLAYLKSGYKKGKPLPWKCHDGGVNDGHYYPFRFRPQELTVWAGASGIGKSMLTTQVATHLARNGEPACIASFEMSPMMTTKRIIEQEIGKKAMEYGNPDVQKISDALDLYNRKLWIYSKVGRATSNEIFMLAKFVSEVHGVKHLFIDCLAKCVEDEDDYNGQKRFVTLLIEIAIMFDLHVHLVHHMSKGGISAKGYETKAGIKGSGAITDLAFNIFTLQPNYKKLDADKEHKLTNELRAEPDLYLDLIKQRNDCWLGKIPLWYSKNFSAECDTAECIPPAAYIENKDEVPF
jgi:twinkle protein